MAESISRATYRKGLKHSTVMAMCSILKGMLAIIPPILIAKNIGLGNITDAYLMALSINQIIIKFLRLGTLPKIYIMALSDDFVKNKGNMKITFNIFFNFSLFFSLLICLLIYAIAPFLVNLIAAGFSSEKRLLTTDVVRILIYLLPYQLIISLFEAVFKLYNEFSRWAMLDLIAPLIVAVFTAIFIMRLGIYSVIYGTIAGASAHVVLLAYNIYARFKLSYRPMLNFKNTQIKKIPGLLYPYYFSSMFVQVTLGIQSFLASLLPMGFASAYFYALKMKSYIEDFSVNIVSEIAFPYFIKKIVHVSINEIRNTYSQLICFANYIFLPVLIIFSIFGVQIVEIMLGSKFSDPDIVLKLGLAFSCFMVFFLPEPSNSMQFSIILAAKKNLWFNFVNISRMIVVILLSVSLFRYFKFWGIIFSYSITHLQGFIANQWYLQNKYSFENILLNKRFSKIIILNIATAFFCFYFNQFFLSKIFITHIYPKIILVLFGFSSGIVFYGLLSYLFKSEDLSMLFSFFRKGHRLDPAWVK